MLAEEHDRNEDVSAEKRKMLNQVCQKIKYFERFVCGAKTCKTSHEQFPSEI